jgi:hypothetical protein
VTALARVAREVREDLAAAQARDPAARSVRRLEMLLTYSGVQALLVHRVSHALHAAGVPLLPRLLAYMTTAVTGVEIHPAARIGRGLFIDHGAGVVIGVALGLLAALAVVAAIAAALAAARDAIAARKAELVRTRVQLEAREAELAAVRDRKAAALDEVHTDIERLEGDISDIQGQIQAQISAASSTTPLPAGPIQGGSSGWIWPVNGPITSPFCSRMAVRIVRVSRCRIASITPTPRRPTGSRVIRCGAPVERAVWCRTPRWR